MKEITSQFPNMSLVYSVDWLSSCGKTLNIRGNLQERNQTSHPSNQFSIWITTAVKKSQIVVLVKTISHHSICIHVFFSVTISAPAFIFFFFCNSINSSPQPPYIINLFNAPGKIGGRGRACSMHHCPVTSRVQGFKSPLIIIIIIHIK